MVHRSSIRLYACLAAALMMLLVSVPADAQFANRSLEDPATGEAYHIEGSIGFWSPGAEMTIASESLGIPGDTINFRKDLGLTDQRFREMQLVLRPSKKSKFRFQYIPIKYQQTATVSRNITFNGQLYRLGLDVESTLSWKAYRFTYEYDFVSRSRGFGGFLLEAKYTDVAATLDSPSVANSSIHEFARARAPIPAIGGIVRVYVMPNIAITTELSGITVPASVSDRYNAHYADLDIYGTVNFNNNIGFRGGYRSFDVGYLIDKDTGSFVLSGIYFGVVARY